ncbi:MAG: GntR family transcriptional regulator [Granulosicoccus sp.]
MALSNPSRGRRTTVDEIFDYVHEEILTLRLRPGDKISEADIASRFGVSRQPVRDAFSRLENLELLKIRPQRATEVRRFSMREIEKARFVRAAVETEVLRRAASHCDDASSTLLDDALDTQREVLREGGYQAFTQLDYEFHQLLCEIAQVSYAFEVIASEKAKVDRLCLLSLSHEHRMPQLVEDHEAIATAVKNGDIESAVSSGMFHLSRLDNTIDSIVKTRADYFES